MNYDKIIIELLDRIKKLEERVDILEMRRSKIEEKCGNFSGQGEGRKMKLNL